MYYTYVLRSLKNNRLYTGSSDNVTQRLKQHNAGMSKYTRLTRPFALIYQETYTTRAEAMRREAYLKTGKGRAELKRILEKNDEYVPVA